MPWSVQSLRAGDAIGILLFSLLAASTLIRGSIRSPILVRRGYLLVVLLSPMLWHATLFLGEDPAGMIKFSRWVIAIAWGGVLARLSAERDTRAILFRGMLVGALACTGVVAMQATGLFELTQRIGLAPQDSRNDVVFREIWRVPGMEVNVNASAAVISLGAPIALGLLDEGILAKWKALAAIGGAFLGAALTLNRSSVLVIAVVGLVWMFLSSGKKVSGTARAFALSIVVIFVIYVGPPGGWERWQELDRLQSSGNLEVRTQTASSALKLAFENPLGLGRSYQDILLVEAEVGSDATHNAFLTLALLSGLPIALLIFGKYIWYGLSLFRFSTVEQWLALQMTGLFFFEEFFGAQTFVILTVWLLMDTWKPWTKLNNFEYE